MTIREATTDDAGLLAEMIREAFATDATWHRLAAGDPPRGPHSCTPEWVAQQMAKAVCFYLLVIDEVPCGCAGLEQDDQETCHLKRLAVRPAFRGRGLGEALVAHVLRQAKALGAARVTLGLIADNTRLRDWYVRQGFVVEREAERHERLPFALTHMSRSLE